MSRTVVGPTARVVVIGAGLSGLAAALHLTGAGHQVTVVERADHPGGRVGRYRGPDYEIDNGATILTMPELIDQALAAVGSDTKAVRLRIHRVDPSYSARYHDGSTIALHADPDAMYREVTRVCGSAEADRYLQLRGWLAAVFDAEYHSFLDTDFDSALGLVADPRSRRDLRKLVALGGFGSLGRHVASMVADPRLRRLFTFQALYAGLAPESARGVYAAIPHMDTSLGVFYPEGGMRAVAGALAEALTHAGGKLELNTEVHGIDYHRTGPRRRRARSVRITDGRRFDCDAVVLTADLGSAQQFGLRRRRGLRAAPSAVVAHGTIPAAVAAAWPVQAHHTIDFGAAWSQTFAEITARRGRATVMSDPSLLLTRPALSDPGQVVARADGRYEPLSLLAPCPNLHSAPLDWARLGPAYLRELLGELENRGYHGIADNFTVDRLDTPDSWARAGMLAGTPFSVAHTFPQTGPFRPRNRPRGLDNVVLAGCGTTPGVGVPTALLSGKHAALRITASI